MSVDAHNSGGWSERTTNLLQPLPTNDAVLAQGFAFKPGWWRQRLGPWWPESLETLPPPKRGGEYRLITRKDVFDVAGIPSPWRHGRTLAAAYIWGTGNSAFLVGRRARVFSGNPSNEITRCLDQVAEIMGARGPAAAYESMLGGRPNKLVYLGPSFFTKFLYYCGYQLDLSPQPLILDRFVAMGINRIMGSSVSEIGPWSAADYESYVGWAKEAAPQGEAHRAEVMLFELGRSEAERRRKTGLR